MYSYFLTGWRAGLRGRAIHAILIVALMLVGVAYLSGSFSPRQPQTGALDVGYSGMRISLILFGLFWVEQLLSREIGSRGILLTLTYPVPRSYYLVGRYLAVVALLGLAALMLGAMLWLAVKTNNPNYQQGFPPSLGLPFWTVVVGLWLDATLVAAFTLLIASLATVPMLPLTLGLGFAIAGKTLGAVLDYLARGADGNEDILKMSPLLEGMQWVLPDLSRLDWRPWALYGVQPTSDELLWPVLMAISYVLILLALSVQVFARREFL
jgi:ABC-type transport system involved in multi-copper enzyme maturation permease subunit